MKNVVLKKGNQISKLKHLEISPIYHANEDHQ